MQELNLPSASAALLITIHTSEFQICIIQIPLLKVYDIFSNSVVNLQWLTQPDYTSRHHMLPSQERQNNKNGFHERGIYQSLAKIV